MSILKHTLVCWYVLGKGGVSKNYVGLVVILTDLLSDEALLYFHMSCCHIFIHEDFLNFESEIASKLETKRNQRISFKHTRKLS